MKKKIMANVTKRYTDGFFLVRNGKTGNFTLFSSLTVEFALSVLMFSIYIEHFSSSTKAILHKTPYIIVAFVQLTIIYRQKLLA